MEVDAAVRGVVFPVPGMSFQVVLISHFFRGAETERGEFESPVRKRRAVVGAVCKRRYQAHLAIAWGAGETLLLCLGLGRRHVIGELLDLDRGWLRVGARSGRVNHRRTFLGGKP